MELTCRHAGFKKLEKRLFLVNNLSKIIDPISTDHFTPYKANENDDRHFVLDSANNWRIIFEENSDTAFTITYRYCLNDSKEKELRAWLEVIGFCDKGVV